MSMNHQEIMDGYRRLAEIRLSNDAKARNCTRLVLTGNFEHAAYTATRFRTGEAQYRSLSNELSVAVQAFIRRAI